MSNVKENFLRYVQIETTSSETSGTCPSTPNQWVLAKMLVDELHAMGIENARIDDHCYVYATIPAKGNHPAKVGLISHMDTSDGVKGPTHPVIIEHYDGRAITLKNGVVIDGFPFLKDLQGQELIVTSGDSVLGADDKAGVAEIMALCKRLTAPDAPEHCTVCIGFTPDEEIGSGADHFDVAGFGADYAYTVDGGALGELEYENFNAASCAIKVHGVNIHPGSAKNQMRNALLMAIEWNSMLPPAETPAHTCGYEGFYHLMNALGADIVFNHADYRLISARVLDSFADYKEVNIFLRGMVPLVGFQSEQVFYERHERLAGESHYPLRKMLALAFDGITSLSNKPIRLITGAGIVVSLISFIGVIWAIVQAAMGSVVAGWASTICIVCFVGGVQLVCLGVIGEYIGKIYMETKARPRYIISERTWAPYERKYHG